MDNPIGKLLERLGRHRTPVIAGVAVLIVLAAAIAIPRLGGSDDDKIAVSPGPGSGGGGETGVGPGGSASDAAPGAPGEQSGGAGDVGTAPGGGAATGGGGSTVAGGGGTPARSGPIVKARGVSDDKIKIGIGVPNIGVLANASASFDIGDVREQMEAVLDGWKREGIVPIHGRDVEFTYREFNIIGSDEQIAACNAFVRDDKVFAVLGVRSFEAGADCLASQFKTPVVHMRGGSDADFKRLHPYAFTIQASLSRTGRSFIHWAHGLGALKGKDIGVYYGTDAESLELLAQMKGQLSKLGYKVKVEFQTNSRLGGPQDQLAVQRFQEGGVDVAILLVSATAQVNFMNSAEQQGYKPAYIDLDYGDHTSDAASAIYPPEQYGGSFGVTQTRNGQIRAGKGVTAVAEKCLKNYERYSGKTIPRRSPETAEFYTILVGCDDAAVLLRGLVGAGRNLHNETLIGGIEQIRNMEAHIHGNLTFTPAKHYGVQTQRTVKWLAGCTCWKAIGEFEPMSP